MLADDGESGVADEFVVLEERPGDGVFDGDDGKHLRVGCHLVEEDGKRLAGYEINFFVLEEEAGGTVVEATCNALYGYFLSVVHGWFVSKKIPLLEMRAGFSLILYLSTFDASLFIDECKLYVSRSYSDQK